MRRTSGTALLWAGAHLAAGAFLVHAATVTVNHGGAPGYALALYATAGLAAAAAYRAATARPGTPARAAGWCACDRWWTSLGTEHDTWCRNHPSRRTT